MKAICSIKFDLIRLENRHQGARDVWDVVVSHRNSLNRPKRIGRGDMVCR